MNKTLSELNVQLKEQLRLSELKYWRRLHPKAKVKLDKKNDEIIITYPLPKDFELLEEFIRLN